MAAQLLQDLFAEPLSDGGSHPDKKVQFMAK